MKKLILALLLLPSLAFAQPPLLSLQELSNVKTTMTPSDGEALLWDATNGQWLDGTAGTDSATLGLPEYDCVVDDSGGHDYTTMNDAWAGACYKMFIKNGTYTWTAHMLLDDPTKAIWIVGESRDGVLIDNATYTIALYDTDKPSFSNAGTYTLPIGSTILTGVLTTFQTWGIVAGDVFCPGRNSYDHYCYEIKSVDSELQLTFTEENQEVAWSESMNSNYFYGPWYDNIRLESFTISAGSTEVISQRNAGSEDEAYFYRLIAKNLLFDSGVSSWLFYDGIGKHWVVTDISIRSANGDMYIPPGSKISHIDTETVYVYPFTDYHFNTIKGNFHDDNKAIHIGNRYSNLAAGADFTNRTGASIGNIMEDDSGEMIEQLYDSLNLPGSLYLEGVQWAVHDSALSNSYLGGPPPATLSTGQYNLFITAGTVSSAVSTGSYNMVFGDAAGDGLTGGARNMLLGTWAGERLAGGSDNVFIGSYSGNGNTVGVTNTGSYNSALGTGAGYYLESGNDNILIGRATGASGQDGDIVDGISNIIIGTNAGFDLIADPSNKIFIDNAASDTPLIYGEMDNNLIRINGSFGLGDIGSKPTCDATMTGQMWYDAGGAGVADTFEVCAKNASDAYVWFAIATIP